jgi:hypothetical protein
MNLYQHLKYRDFRRVTWNSHIDALHNATNLLMEFELLGLATLLTYLHVYLRIYLILKRK